MARVVDLSINELVGHTGSSHLQNIVYGREGV